MTDVDWNLLDRYAAGRCTPAERFLVEQWLVEAPMRRELLADLQSAVQLAGETAELGREAEILASLRQRWGTPSSVAASPVRPSGPLRLIPSRSGAPRWLLAAKIAAAAALVAGMGMAARLTLTHPHTLRPLLSQPMAIAVSTARGERRTLTLSDGTVVDLAPASTLRWSPGYGLRDRIVELDGEAVFTVVHDAGRPFAVQTPHAVTHDLGTKFAVRAYPGDTVTDVAVVDGVVAVLPRVFTSKPQADSVVLRHGDRAQVRRAESGAIAVSRDVPLDEFFAWTSGRLIIRDLPLRDAVAQLGRWYDLEVRYDSEALGGRSVSASFEDEPGGEAVRVVAAILGLQVSRTGRIYTLRAK